MSDTTTPSEQHITTKESKNGKALLIEVVGHLDFQLHRQFREAYEQRGQPYLRYIINLKDCHHMDSCGLGMLLLLKEYSELDRDDIRLINCRPQVKNVLSISKFNQLFVVE